MELAVTFLAVSVIYYAFFRREIAAHKQPLTGGIVMTIAAFLFIPAASIAVKAAGFDPRIFIFAAWMLAAVLEYKKELKENTLATAFLFLFGLAMLSFFMLPYNKFTAYIFPVSGGMFLLFTAEIHKDVFVKKGPVAAYFFAIAAVITVKLYILANLPEWISVPVTVLAALFIILRKSKGAEHYMEEKTAVKTAALFYTALLIQLFVAAVLKNPLFN